MDIVMLRSIFTVLVFAAFIGVVIWAYSGRRKAAFDEAAQLPFAQDDLAEGPDNQKDNSHE